jgi:hypothetical protein
MEDLKIKLKEYISNNLVIEKPKKKLINKFFDFIEDRCCDDIDVSFGASQKECSSIKDFIDKHEDYNDFQTMLFKLIDDRNLKDSDVYNKVHIDRRLFSKIRSDKNYHPSKETIILLAIALELSENELDDLLESASYSLPKNNKYDLIIRFCFINKIFKLSDINELLYEYRCRLFNY